MVSGLHWGVVFVIIIITSSPTKKNCSPGGSLSYAKGVRRDLQGLGSVYSSTAGAGAWMGVGLAVSRGLAVQVESLSRSLAWLPAHPSGRLGWCPGMRAPREK